MFQTVSQPLPSLPAASPSPASFPAPPEGVPLAAPAPPEALPPEAARAIAALFGEGRVVAHRPCFARLFGGAACGVLLSQFWFWTGTPTVQQRTGGWFWKPQREITEETGLSRAETETARRRLCEQGILEEKRCGIPATMHFRVDIGAVLRRVWAYLQAQAGPQDGALSHTGVRGTRTLVCGIVASKFAGIAQSTSEIISEKTQEITQTRARPVLPSAFADRSRVPERKPLREVRVTAAAVLGAVVRAVTGETAGGMAGGVALSTGQQAVNLSGVARLKAALAAAARGSAHAPGVWKPPAEECPSDEVHEDTEASVPVHSCPKGGSLSGVFTPPAAPTSPPSRVRTSCDARRPRRSAGSIR